MFLNVVLYWIGCFYVFAIIIPDGAPCRPEVLYHIERTKIDFAHIVPIFKFLSVTVTKFTFTAVVIMTFPTPLYSSIIPLVIINYNVKTES